MTVSVTPIQDDVFTSIRAFIRGVLPCEVIQGLGNRVSMPLSGFVAMTQMAQNRLSTNVDSYADPTPTTGTVSAQQAMQITVQLDCYGPQSADWASILSTLLRDEYACIALAPLVQPLHADDPRMLPLIDGEEQYEQRWTLDARFQVKPIVITPMQFFDEAEVGLIEVDAAYPP